MWSKACPPGPAIVRHDAPHLRLFGGSPQPHFPRTRCWYGGPHFLHTQSRCCGSPPTLPPYSMQVWRINHLIYMDEEEAVAELERHRCVCVGGGRYRLCIGSPCMLREGVGSKCEERHIRCLPPKTWSYVPLLSFGRGILLGQPRLPASTVGTGMVRKVRCRERRHAPAWPPTSPPLLSPPQGLHSRLVCSSPHTPPPLLSSLLRSGISSSRVSTHRSWSCCPSLRWAWQQRRRQRAHQQQQLQGLWGKGQRWRQGQ